MMNFLVNNITFWKKSATNSTSTSTKPTRVVPVVAVQDKGLESTPIVSRENILLLPNKYIPEQEEEEEENDDYDDIHQDHVHNNNKPPSPPSQDGLSPTKAHNGPTKMTTTNSQAEMGNVGGREIRYETSVLYSPVFVCTRPSTSNQTLESQRLILTKDEMDDLNNCFHEMVLDKNKKTNTVIQKDDSMTTTTTTNHTANQKKTNKSNQNNNSMNNNNQKVIPEDTNDSDSFTSYGRYTTSIRLSPNTQPIQVTRSCRLTRV